MKSANRFAAKLAFFLLIPFSIVALGQSGAPVSPPPSGARTTPSPSSSAVTTSGGTIGTIPEFHTATDIENSPIVDSGGNIGIANQLTVNGASKLATVTAQSLNGVLNAASFGGSDIGAQINSAVAALPTGYGGYKTGTILLPSSNVSIWSTPVVIGPGTNLIGQGKFGSIFNCTVTSVSEAISNIVETSGSVVTLTVGATAGISVGQQVYLSGLTVGTWLNSQKIVVTSFTATTLVFNDPTSHGTQSSTPESGTAVPVVACLTVDHSAQSGQFAHTVLSNSKIENFAIQGNGAVWQNIIHFKDVQGLEVHSVVADGATDPLTPVSGACFWLDDVNWWTERNTFFDDSSGYNCNIGWRFTAGPAHVSFGYNRFLDIKANTAGPQTAFSVEGSAYIYSGTYRLTINKGDKMGVGGSIVWHMQDSASFYENELQLMGEENGSGGYFLDITSASNQFTYWGNIIWGGGTANNVVSGATLTHWLDSNYFTAAGNFAQNSITWAVASTLPNGYNLNTAKSCGNYEVTSPVNGPTVSPSSALLHLQVVCAGSAGPGYVEQIIYQANYTGKVPLVFQRNEDGGTWGSWYSVFDGTAGAGGQATCWKSTGQIGYCSTAVGSTGACTCH